MIGGALGVIVLFLAACGGSSTPSAAEQELQRKADLYDIEQIESTYHQALTLKDIDMMMGLFAPNATLTIGPGETAAGLDQIRRFWLNATPFMAENTWVSDHPAYKVEVTVNGDRGTLHFECHFVDYRTGAVELATVVDQDVARIDGRWLITNAVAGSTTLAP
ncbi:MAG: nuclear transport factor 2 family protein [Actinomycetota bacterium]